LCNLAYHLLRRELVESLVMCDGKDRVKALEQFELDLYAPLDGGWEAADRRLQEVINSA
jgi:hypothetical protein